MTRNDVTLTRLHELLSYDPGSGHFVWRDSRSRNRARGIAGRLTPEGYRDIKVDGRAYMAHRLAWFYMHGDWPGGQIDHINRDRSDNRLVNLRVVTRSENQQNTLARGATGVKGVHWNKRQQKWTAKIVVAQKCYHLGTFGSLDAAASAYRHAAAQMHTCNPEASL